MPKNKLSPTMRAVVDRLSIGDGTIVPKQGGYWLPGDVAYQYKNHSGDVWHTQALHEFNGHHVGTQTINALRDRGILEMTSLSGYDNRRWEYALKVHRLKEHPNG